jgi:16S rRNA (cytidine1402-2'-O)-methyltransferase
MKESNAAHIESRTRKSKETEKGFGKLYVVSTPIGNLEDITLRALNVLKEVDIVAAENVSRTRGLLRHYQIHSKVVSYNQHNQRVKSKEFMGQLKNGYNIAIVSDAGTPGISDPGAYLIREVGSAHIDVIPIPGPSAVITAISISGFPSERFVFMGFLPNKAAQRRRVLKEVVFDERTLVFFEAPHRIKAMLKDMYDILGDRQMVMLREMTKLFEEIKRGPIHAIMDHLIPDGVKGEFTLVVSGRGKGEKAAPLDEKTENRIKELLVDKKMRVKEAANLLSREDGLPYREMYKECLAKKRQMEGI